MLAKTAAGLRVSSGTYAMAAHDWFGSAIRPSNLGVQLPQIVTTLDLHSFVTLSGLSSNNFAVQPDGFQVWDGSPIVQPNYTNPICSV